MKKVVVITIALMLSIAMQGQQSYLFRGINSSNGLSENNVRNIIMLPNGTVCIQTSTMLNIYDGTNSRSYSFDPLIIPYREYAGLNNLYYADHILYFSCSDQVWSFDLTTRQFSYDCAHLLQPYDLPNSKVTSIDIAPDGNFCVCLENGDLYYCEQESLTANKIALPKTLSTPLRVTAFEGNLWMLTLEGTLACYDIRKASFTAAVPNIISNVSSRMEIVHVPAPSHLQGASGALYMMFDNEILRYQIDGGEISKILTKQENSGDVFTSIAYDGAGKLWIGSAKGGLTIYNIGTRSTETLPYISLLSGEKIDHNTDISKVYVDQTGGVWVGTLTEGLFYHHADIFQLQSVNNEGGEIFVDQNIKCIAEQADGQILLGTIDGLVRYNPGNGRISIPYPQLAHELCTGLYRDSKGRIWLGTFRNGAFCIDGGNIRHYFYDGMPTVEVSYHENTPNLNSVRSFHEDSRGNFWICVYGGVGRFNIETGEIALLRESHPELSSFMLTRGVAEFDGRLLATSDNGHFIYDIDTDSIVGPLDDADHRIPCVSAIIDSRGLHWVAATDGLHVRVGFQDIIRLSTHDGLPNDNVLGVVEDNLGNVWAATYNAITRIKVINLNGSYSFAMTTFGKPDGMDAGTLFPASLIAASDGRIYAGGSKGFCVADPARLYQQSSSFEPKITVLSILNRVVNVGEKYGRRVILTKEIMQTERIVLNHRQTYLTFRFSDFNYINPSHTNYRYKLENFDKDWNDIQEVGAATYTLLSPGEYVFKVISADNDVDWSDTYASLSIKIKPPFYSSIFAYILYVLLFLSGAGLFVYELYRKIRRQELERLKTERERQKEEMNQLKFRFFTNISHELRTPLSLIILPLESILKRSDETLPFRQQLETMHKHAQQLLTMVNHLLDYRKLEVHGETLNLSYGNIVDFVRAHVASFEDVCLEKGLAIEFDNQFRGPMVAFDSPKFYKIINNLLSNAIKFTPKGGVITVTLSSQGDMVVIEVTDTGIGISEADQSHIFERFYQGEQSTDAPQGSGIGLWLVKEYIHLHGGDINVYSELGAGSTFRVEWPIRPAEDGAEAAEGSATRATTIQPDDTPSGISGVGGDNRKRLLVIDDNADFREYLSLELSSDFNIIFAADGELGLSRCQKYIIDLVICDVMMPRMDGFEVCRRLKSDINTSHIPVILLTAHANDQVQRKCYEAGADAYLGKPFSMDILLARVNNLLEDRKRKQSEFANTVELSPSQITVTPVDKKLMDRVMESIERNMGNPKFSVEDLAADVAMHRMHLYRKLRSITGSTPSEFLRTVRLKRAAQILAQDPNVSVAAVSETVGFTTPKYFSIYFADAFGCAPSKYYEKVHSGTPPL